jgi:hypothetical protein
MDKDQLELEKLHAEIALLIAQAAKSSKEAKWYELVLASAVTMAGVAIAKLIVA